MSLCPQCGEDNRGKALFCLNCGADLPHAEADTRAGPIIPAGTLDDTLPLAESPAGGTPPDIPSAADRPPEPTAPPAAVAEEPDDPDAGPDTGEITLIGRTAAGEPNSERETGFSEPTPLPSKADSPPVTQLDREEAAVEQEESSPPTVSGEPAAQEPLPQEALPPLEPGTVLDDRYEILALLEEDRETLLYEASDRGRCPQCGYSDALSSDQYCASCGASLADLAEPPRVLLRCLQVSREAVLQSEVEEAERWFDSGGRLYAVLSASPPESVPDPFARGVKHVVGYSSDPGMQRELDEDSVLALTLAPLFESTSRPSLGLYAVADGMGGHEGGEIASRVAIRTLAESVISRLFLPELSGEPVPPGTPEAMLEEAIRSINATICELQETTGSDMGTTLTVAVVRDDYALIGNVGDSRTYLWRDAQLAQLTTDHSLVAQMVAAGVIAPEQVYTHPEKSAIYRSLGHMPDVEVDLFTQSLRPGDCLVLCCDGVWEMLRDDGIEEVLLLEYDPQRACDEIVRRCNLAGGEDNISVVVVRFKEVGSG